MPIAIDRIDHVVLTVASPAATCDFYRRVLGMEVRTFGPGRTALFFGRQKINLHPADEVILPRAHRPTEGSADLCFITNTPMAEVVAHLDTCGVPIIEGPDTRSGATGAIMSVYFRDPDQNLVEVSNYGADVDPGGGR